MKKKYIIILIFAITLCICLSIVLASYIFGNLIKEGLIQLGVNLNDGLRSLN